MRQPPRKLWYERPVACCHILYGGRRTICHTESSWRAAAHIYGDHTVAHLYWPGILADTHLLLYLGFWSNSLRCLLHHAKRSLKQKCKNEKKNHTCLFCFAYLTTTPSHLKDSQPIDYMTRDWSFLLFLKRSTQWLTITVHHFSLPGADRRARRRRSWEQKAWALNFC